MKLLPRTLLDELTTKATASPRARAHFNVHVAPSDPVQRFFVVANRGTYFRPHRHNTKSELALIVRGRFDVVLFDAEGRVTARYTIGDGTPSLGYETAQGTWHTLVADTDGAAFFEVKEGPYDPATSSEFASWAPAEGHESVPKFLEWLKSAQAGDLASPSAPPATL